MGKGPPHCGGAIPGQVVLIVQESKRVSQFVDFVSGLCFSPCPQIPALISLNGVMEINPGALQGVIVCESCGIHYCRRKQTRTDVRKTEYRK